MRYTLIADRLFDGDIILGDVPLSIEDGRILCLDTVSNAKEIRLEGLIAPGFIDIQVNGGGGVLFNAEASVATIGRISKTHIRYGTTAFLPTLITDDLAVMDKAADAVSQALEEDIPGVMGIHFEGPHISTAKKGVHSENYIRELSEHEQAIYLREDIGVCHLTMAPEMVSPEVIGQLTDKGIIISLGHSNATFEVVQDALAAGAKGFTHLYNAMSSILGREPGMVGAALLSKAAWCGLIMDGYHIHNASARLAIESKPRGKIILVTDSMPPVGTDDSDFELLGEKVKRTGNMLTAPDGQLAGSVLDMASAVRNTVKDLDIALDEALRMASHYPAEFLGLGDETGTLTPGKRADFILLNDEIRVKSTWVGGIQRY